MAPGSRVVAAVLWYVTEPREAAAGDLSSHAAVAAENWELTTPTEVSNEAGEVSHRSQDHWPQRRRRSAWSAAAGPRLDLSNKVKTSVITAHSTIYRASPETNNNVYEQFAFSLYQMLFINIIYCAYTSILVLRHKCFYLALCNITMNNHITTFKTRLQNEQSIKPIKRM